MVPDRVKISVVIVVVFLAAMVVVPAAAEDIIVNDAGTLAGGEDCDLTATDDTSPPSYDDPGAGAMEGTVSITTSGTGVYYLGEEITLSGTNTASDTVYLFLTGPNLDHDGVNLTLLRKVDPADPNTFDKARVNADDTWSKKWDTGATGRYLDAGGYTIYAVAEPRCRSALSGTQYATASIQLRSPFVTATASAATIARGDELTISGRATGAPANVYVWIFGKNFYGGAGRELNARPISVEADGSFEEKLKSSDTENLATGRYFVIVQHPMGASATPGPGAFSAGSIIWNPAGTITGNGINSVTLTNLQAAAAASALINALDSPNVPDIYTKFSFRIIEEGWIQIDPISNPTYGKTFTVTGTTDYWKGTVLIYEIIEEYEGFALSGETVVTDGGCWSIEVDTTAIGPGAFTLRVTAPNGLASATAVFDIYDDVTHPTPWGGAAYRVERISTTPALDDLASGKEVTLYGTLSGTFWAEHQGDLAFLTDLENPTWSGSVSHDGVGIYTQSGRAKSLILTAFELNYGRGEIQILLTLSGTVPDIAGTNDPILLRILQRGGDGRIIPNSEYRLPLTPAGDNPPSPNNLTLFPGWNFISIPRPLAAENDTAAIFAGVETGGRSVLRYDTIAGDWIALKEEDRITPLEGFWIYSTGPTAVPLNFSTNPLLPPAERTLVAGWNAIGTTGNTPATARDTLYSVKGRWTTLIGFNARSQTFETGIINGGSGANADTRSVYPGRGYWLHMTGPGTLCAIGA